MAGSRSARFLCPRALPTLPGSGFTAPARNLAPPQVCPQRSRKPLFPRLPRGRLRIGTLLRFPVLHEWTLAPDASRMNRRRA